MKTKSIIPETFEGYTEADALALVRIRSSELGKGSKAQREADRIREELGDVIESMRIYERMVPWKKPPPKPKELKQIKQCSEKLLRLLNVEFDGKPNAEPGIRQELHRSGATWAYDWVAFHELPGSIEKQDAKEGMLRQHREHGEWPPKRHRWEVQEDGSERHKLGEDEALRSAIQGIQRLRTWASIAASRLEVTPYPKTEPDRKRLLRTVLVERLIHSYNRLFGEGAFGIVTYNYGELAGTVGGKHVEFIQRALSPLGIIMEAFAIAKAFRNMPK